MYPEELARRSAELHARVDASARIANPRVDQDDAECTEARRLAPRENKILRSNPAIQAAIRVALTSIDRDVEPATGPVPVIRLRPFFPKDGSVEYTRNGSEPISDRTPVRYCNACSNPTSRTVHFWIACGTNIVQIDLCDKCGAYYMDCGAVPQLGLSEN